MDSRLEPMRFRDMAAARHRGGKRLLVAAAMTALGACAVERGPIGGGQQPGRPAPILSPLLTLTGARLAPAADRSRTPLPRNAALTTFVHPVAAALLGNEIYVADSAPGRVYRFDATLGLMTAVPSAPAVTGTRLAVGADFSLYVLDPPRRRVVRLARDGRLLATYSNARELIAPIAFTVDEARGEVLIADAQYRYLVVFHPLGGAYHVLHFRDDERVRVLSVAALTLVRDEIHVSDPACSCVAAVSRSGAVRTTYGHGQIAQPGAIASDRHGRVFIADRVDGSVKVFADGRLVAAAQAAALGIREVSDLWVGESQLAIADGAGARVVIMRIAPPSSEAR